MYLVKYKSELRTAFKHDNVKLMKALVELSMIDEQCDEQAREEISAYAGHLRYRLTRLKRLDKESKSIRKSKENTS